jgi:ATP-dependent Lhr-like helicase
VPRVFDGGSLGRGPGGARPRSGEAALLGAIEKLEGAPIPLAALERDVLPLRMTGYQPGDLDALLSSGEIVWRGLAPIAGSGRIALYTRASFDLLAPTVAPAEGALVEKVRAHLASRGAVFFHELHRAVGAFPPDVLEALWELVWAGEVTNDTLAPLRSRSRGELEKRRTGREGHVTRILPGSEGRWSLLVRETTPTETERRAALVKSLLARHGVLVREALSAEGIVGGFSAVYEVLRAMEDAGRVRRGYFVEGLGAAQFAHPGAEELLRAERELRKDSKPMVLAATDPASPWGTSLPWPKREGARPMRADGAQVIVAADGHLLAWIGRAERSMLTFLSDDERERASECETIAKAISGPVDRGARRVVMIAQVDGAPAEKSELAAALVAHGFTATSRGLMKRAVRKLSLVTAASASVDVDDDDEAE